jgi:hypothetical protein
MTSATLDRPRLARVLGMLGSSHDGEALAAARQAERLRAEAGLSWGEILLPRLPAPRRQHHHVETFADVIEFVLDFEETLTPWERDFAQSLRRQRSPLSPKQIGILERLVEKVRRAEARAA